MAIFTGRSTPPDPPDHFLGADDVADVFRFTPATLEAADTVVGGGGAVIDILQFTAAGVIAAGRFDGVSGIERIQSHAGGNSYALTQALVAGAFGSFEARGLAGDDRIDASAVSNPALGVSFVSGGGADTLIGGAGADRFNALAASAGARMLIGGGGNDVLTTSARLWSAADLFAGGSGIDRITFAEAGQVTSAQLAGLSGVEEIQFFSNVTLSLAVSDALVAQAGGLLTVIGGAGSGQAVDASAVLNGRVHYLAGTGADTFLGTAGEDLFAVQEAGSTGHLGDGDDILNLDNRKASGIVVDGGAGFDTAVLAAGGVWDLTGLANFEQLELAGTGTVLLPNQTGLRVLGSEQRDFVTLGAPGQTVFGFGGDDMVLVTAATLVGAVLHGGGQATSDILRMTEPGTYDFRRIAITGFERFETTAAPVAAGPSTIFLPGTPLDLLLRHGASVVLGANPAQAVVGSVRADSFTLGAAGQFVEGGGGNDTVIGNAATLGAGTILAGGPGLDLLLVQGGGSVDLTIGALALGIEWMTLESATALLLDTTPGIEIVGSAGADTVTANGAGVSGSLGNGSDLLRVNLTHLAAAGAETMTGGAGNDTLSVVDASALFFQTSLPSRFTGFERIDLSGLIGAQVTIEGAEARHVLLGTSNAFVTGGSGNDVFEVGSSLANVVGGDGNDTMIQTAAPGASQFLVGVGGDDEIVYDRSAAGSVTATMPVAWAAETVRLLGTHSFTANTAAGIAFIGDPALGNSITLRGNNQSFQGGSGADTMTASGGLGSTLAGGEGADLYLISTSEQALWDTPGRAIIDTPTGFVLNVIRIEGTGSLAIDFNAHTVQHIDRIEINAPTAAVGLILTDAMAASADGNNGGGTGDFLVEAPGFMTAGLRLDASAFAAARSLRAGGPLGGDDTIIGGEGADSIGGSVGADSIVGGAGADSLLGGDGADTVLAGAGADTVIGGQGGDVIALAETSQAADILRYTSVTDGTVDINDAVSVSQSSADAVSGFNALVDKVQLGRAGLGLGTGGIVTVAPNGAWNISSGAVFLFESDSVLGDTLNSNNFANFGSVAFGINSDNGSGSGSSINRTVALVISNPETNVPRSTGLYVWTDSDGDSVLEASDALFLLGVFHGVTANEMSLGSALQIIA